MPIILVASILLGLAASVQAANLEALRWERRVLLLFSTDVETPKLREQRRRLDSADAALSERQMLVLTVVGDRATPIFGAQKSDLVADELRRRFSIRDAPFTAVLVGLDGVEKWRSSEPAPLEAINEVIDSMPMRRAGTDR